jgi:membrane-bound serine protease (ClpP class)
MALLNSELWLNPYLSGFLFLLMITGIVFELKFPTSVLPILLTIFAGVLLIMPYYIYDWATPIEVVLFLVGVGLLLLEIFIIPNFGVVGVIGIGLTLLSYVAIIVPNNGLNFSNLPHGLLNRAIASSCISIIGSVVMFYFLTRYFHKTAVYKKVALHKTLNAEDGYQIINDFSKLIGKKGIAHTVLRPIGKIIINDKVYEATSKDGFIERGTQIEVITQEGNYLKVKKLEHR